MPRKGENIYKRKDGRWEGRYIKARTDCGKAVYGYVYAKSYSEVKKKQRCAMTAAETSESDVQSISMCSNFGDVAREWLCSQQPQVKESTYIRYHNLLYTYLMPDFEHIPVENLTSEQISCFCNRLLTVGGVKANGLSPKTVADILSVMRNIFGYAQCRGIHLSCTGKETSVRQTPKEFRVLSITEQKKLCQYLESHLSSENFGILMCLFTGLRIGEICALKWEDILLNDKTIHVHQTMLRIQTPTAAPAKTKVIITTPKSACSIRTIPVPEALLRVINSSFPIRNGYVLTGNDSYMEPRAMQYHFKRVLKAAKIEPVNFHVLRHTFATRCIEAGFDVKSLSEILGHANVNITMNRYVHPTMQLKQANMQKLSDLLAVS